MRLRVGVLLDEFGRPMRSLYRDEEPSRARTSALNGTPQYRGQLVVGRSGAKMHEPGSQTIEAQRERTRRFRERHGGRKAVQG